MTDLELLDHFCETSLDHIQITVLKEIENRWLTRYVNFLPRNIQEAKVAVRIRLKSNENTPMIQKLNKLPA